MNLKVSEDVLEEVISYMPNDKIFKMMKTSKDMENFIKTSKLWCRKLNGEFISF